MTRSTRRILAGAAVLVAGAGATVALTGGSVQAHDGLNLTSIQANVDTRGYTAPNTLSPQLRELAVAQGSYKLENPVPDAQYYGYSGDGPHVPDVLVPPGGVESTKTEPDKNTYLRMPGLKGADPGYNYGSRFLFQGHENGVTGYVTRINLDADPAHRVTLITSKLSDGSKAPAIDGSTWDPWAQRLLFTAENGNKGAVLQGGTEPGGSLQDISFALGRGGYEGVQNDSAGNLLIVEDVGGATPTGSAARNPNSFVYRFLPADRTDLTKGGKLQALQVFSARTHQPITFKPVDNAANPQSTGGIFTDDQKDLSDYGTTFNTTWVTVHDTASDPSGQPFDANALAKAAGATPFKRPENGVFRPGTNFREFYFTVTGDTNANSPANAGFGGWGGVFKLEQAAAGADKGRLSLFFRGDADHTGLDNIAFIDRDHVAVVEDRGDGLHTQRGMFDSGYLLDTQSRAGAVSPVRFLAEGRDSAATLDNELSGTPGWKNDGDNEITGIHMSDGDPTAAGILGAKLPKPFEHGWRLFWTQQHGDNVTYEIKKNS
jgi:hypothetical protein